MKTLHRLAAVLLWAALLPFFASAQSPWVRSKSGFYGQVAYHFIPAYDSYFGVQNSAEYKLEREISERTAQIYGEYGLTKKTTLVLNVPLCFLESGDAVAERPLPNQFPRVQAGKLAGPGNVSLALRRNVYQKNGLALSGTLRVDLPSKRFDDSTGLRARYNALTIMPIGSAGMGFRRAYFFGYMGFGYRTNDYSHLYLLGAEAGLRLGSFWLIGFSELNSALNNGTIETPTSSSLTKIYVDGQDYWSVGLKGIYEINRFAGVVVSGAGAFTASLLPKSPGIGVGAYFKWD